MSRPFVLVPVRSLSAGKSRLAGALEPEVRRALNRYFLRRLLMVASEFAGEERCAIVSPCDEALAAARRLGVHAIRQSGPEGLNPGVAQGVRALWRGAASDVLVVSCDLPDVLASDLVVVNELGTRHRTVVIGADHHGLGTNLLFIPSGTSLRFQFGAQSLRSHVREARRAGVEPLVLVDDRIGFDVDTPGDLRRWRGRRSWAACAAELDPAPTPASPLAGRRSPACRMQRTHGSTMEE